MDVRAHNRTAWNREVDHQNPWTVPASPEMIAAARRGDWWVLLTGTKPVPRARFPDLVGCTVLCLASGGGQQGPMLAAAGAQVTVFDNSPRQLAQDRLVADRDGLTLTTVEGDMADLSVFPDASFELVFHPVSNLFVPDVRPVWAEVFRVLRRGGLLLAGFLNPVEYVFDRALADQGVFQVRFRLPYSDLTSLAEEERAQTYGADAPMEFSHTLDDQIGGQLAVGLHLTGFYEDYRQDAPIAAYMPSYIATRAIKP
jgi:SAM-dependent methyltransferase